MTGMLTKLLKNFFIPQWFIQTLQHESFVATIQRHLVIYLFIHSFMCISLGKMIHEYYCTWNCKIHCRVPWLQSYLQYKVNAGIFFFRQEKHFWHFHNVTAVSNVCYWDSGMNIGKVKSEYEPSGPSAGAYPGFLSMKQLGVFLLPPGWDASPSQGYPQH